MKVSISSLFPSILLLKRIIFVGLSHNVPLSVAPVRDFVLKKATETVMKKTMGLYPAPLKIIEVYPYVICSINGTAKSWKKNGIK